MTLAYLTLQKGIRISKMTHQQNGWSVVTGNKRTAPIVIVRGPVKEKINFAFSFISKWSKAFIASLLAVGGNSIASKQV